MRLVKVTMGGLILLVSAGTAMAQLSQGTPFPEIKAKDLKKYKAFQAAAWDDKVLLVVPVDLNKRMPLTMRPHLDIYMVYAKSAVEVKAKK